MGAKIFPNKTLRIIFSGAKLGYRPCNSITVYESGSMNQKFLRRQQKLPSLLLPALMAATHPNAAAAADQGLV